VNCVTLPGVELSGCGVVTVSRLPFESYVFVVMWPSGSVTVSGSPKLL
jgi:hypothetical protein